MPYRSHIHTMLVVALTMMVTTFLLSTFYGWLAGSAEVVSQRQAQRAYERGVADGRRLQCAEPRKAAP